MMSLQEHLINWNEIESLSKNKIPWLYYEIEKNISMSNSESKIMQDGRYLSKFCRSYQDLKQAADYVCLVEPLNFVESSIDFESIYQQIFN